MKKYTVLLLFVTAFLFTACEKEVKTHDVVINLQATFSNDKVYVYIDGQKVFDRNANTNPSLGFAGGTITQKSNGAHQIKVVINDSVHKTAIFPLQANLYIGINYSDNNQVSFIYSGQPFAYD